MYHLKSILHKLFQFSASCCATPSPPSCYPFSSLHSSQGIHKTHFRFSYFFSLLYILLSLHNIYLQYMKHNFHHNSFIDSIYLVYPAIFPLTSCCPGAFPQVFFFISPLFFLFIFSCLKEENPPNKLNFCRRRGSFFLHFFNCILNSYLV